jgi:hypothetical protein
MNSLLPRLGQPDLDRILRRLTRRVPGFVPEWTPGNSTQAEALLQVFARYMELLEDGLKQVPERSRLAFLDMLGVELLPAQPARTPLVFSLVENSPVDVTLPALSEVAAQVVTPLTPFAGQEPSAAATLIFSTEQAITVTRARLKTVYSILPGSDEFADHSTSLTGESSFFDQVVPCRHAIYMGHDELFALVGDISVIVSLTFQQGASRYLGTEWEYLTDQGWLPFTLLKEDDATDGLRKDGQMVLRRECGPKAKKDTIEGRTSFWIRGQLTKALLPDGTNGQRTIPVVNDVRVRVKIHKDGIAPDAGFADTITLDTSKDFFPFGERPAQHPTFYIASKEVFQRKGAQVQLDMKLSVAGTPSPSANLATAWEYFDGFNWSLIKPEASAGADTFTASQGSISFLCPRNWTETTVNGAKNFWLRVRVISGDYGNPLRTSMISTRNITAVSADGKTLTVDSNQGYGPGDSVVLLKGTTRITVTIDATLDSDKLLLQAPTPAGITGFANGTLDLLVAAPPSPPVISKLALSYSYATDAAILDHCLTENDFVFADETNASRWPDRSLMPFVPVADARPTIHFGFDQQLPSGLISLFVNVPQVVVGGTETLGGSSFIWEYSSDRGWTELGVLDETAGFRRSGMIQFVGPPDAKQTPGLGGNLVRIRARLKPGEEIEVLPIAGMWLNAVWSNQSRSIEQAPLGQTDGTPLQTFLVPHTPIHTGETLQVLEWTGNGDRWRLDLPGLDEKDLRFEQNPATGEVSAVWVRWQVRPHFYGATENDRCYLIDRARGIIRFGDGVHGRIPPAAKPVRLSYRSGEGTSGPPASTVSAGTIKELHIAVPYVASATNPIAATGGANTEPIEAVKNRGSQRLRHYDRAVTGEDLEWMAHEATPEVARARCLSLVGPVGHAQRGWITLIVVPFSSESQPQPSAETKRRVRDFLAQRVPATLAPRIRVTGPSYVPIGVRAELRPQVADAAAAVESIVRSNLNQFLHPLTGGPNGQGWQFGQAIRLSQIARVIEQTSGVDCAVQLLLISNGHLFDELVPLAPDTIAAAGDHELRLIVGV